MTENNPRRREQYIIRKEIKMSAKTNFTQALKELTGFDEPVEKKEKQYETGYTASAAAKSTQSYKKTPETFTPDIKADDIFDEKFEFSDGFRYEEPQYEKAEITLNRKGSSYITPSMVIRGKVKAQCDVLVDGVVFGDMNVAGNIENKNLVVGDIKAANVAFNGARVKGNTTVEGRAIVANNSTIVGDINAEVITVSSKIKGNLKASDIVVLEQDAIVVGDIMASNFLSSPGANIKGSITTAASMNIDDDIEFDLGVEEYGQ